MNAERERLETEREKNAKMMEELQALKQELQSKVGDKPENDGRSGENKKSDEEAGEKKDE